jgi:MFS family permease
MSNQPSDPLPAARPWLTATVAGIVLATFLSDASHEAVSAVLPLYLAALGLGPAALGLIEGVADLLVSFAKLGGGYLGHRVVNKRPWASLGYLLTALATASIGLAHGVLAILSLRCVAWITRGFRGPLRDAMLADAVPKTHYGRAFGLERAGDMLGAVTGPLIATLLVWAGFEFRSVIFWSLVPGVLAAAAMFFLTRDRQADAVLPDAPVVPTVRPPFPRAFWVFLVGVLLFGMGDFARTFFVLLVARAAGEDPSRTAGAVSLAVLLYAMHNLICAGAAYAIGTQADRTSKPRLLAVGYVLGFATNLLLAVLSESLPGVTVAIVLSAVYVAAEETLEKATAAELLPRELRSLGFGILACGNAVGDMLSSVYVGWLLQAGRPGWAFGIAAGCSSAGAAWMLWHFARRAPRNVVA